MSFFLAYFINMHCQISSCLLLIVTIYHHQFSLRLSHTVLKNRIPWPKDKSFTFHVVIPYIFKNEPDGAEEFHRTCYLVLKHLSNIGISNIPDLLQYLPAPESKNFPEQALGLQLLLDQGPRFSLDGINQRYTNAYFDDISLKFSNNFTHSRKSSDRIVGPDRSKK